MKATQKDFAAQASRAAKGCSIFFFCGPDEGAVQDAALRILSLLPEPGERVEFTGAELRRDVALLGDEARSTSLFGDRRYIWVRASGDEAHDALDALTSAERLWPVIVLAPGATDKGRCAKLLEKRDDSLVVMFYPPDLRSVTQSVRGMASAAGLRMANDLAERIAAASGLDTRLAQSEVTKLALYLDASAERPRDADMAAFAAIGAATQDDGMMPIVNAVLGGDVAHLGAELRRMAQVGLNPVGLLLAVERRAAQLAGLAARMGPGGDARAFIESEKMARRVFWKDADDLARQLSRWRGPTLERLVDRLMLMHRQLLGNSQHADVLLAQGFAEIARAAAKKA
jgi:DNA polymerase-3 subunit delta